MIILENVTKTYSSGTPALNGINLHVQKGEFVFIVGKSGSGKSTLIKLLLKELDPTTGKIYVNKKYLNKITRKKLPYLRRDIGVVFQDFRLLEKKTVYQNVSFAMEILGIGKAEIDKKVHIALSLMGLDAKAKEYPCHLSGGEQQRVALARAVVNTPKILIADEPTGNLDPENSQEIMDLLMKINEKGTTVLVATHEQAMALQSGKRILYLDHGVKIDGAGPELPVAPIAAERTEEEGVRI